MTGAGDDQPVNGSDLCLACGMCCDGTLFRTTTLQPHESPMAAARGAVVVETPAADGTTHHSIAQPCLWWRNGCCSQYADWRPDVCATYECQLLTNFVTGTMTLAQCLEIVDDLRNAVNDAATVDPAPSSPPAILAAATVQVLRQKYIDRPSSESTSLT